ncbi:hypothetical protein C7R54_03195 [Achromobacter aloeverae]|uniref:Glycine zipper 2TM domain-containing protein n=1 Tax=Achromobacter aloeverae TaxID=1750518 RepID=A0A4Q1HNZ4_9BURK|nr:glycine zipper 2TM domain-containing protein [Achromobacter aloeverae]RXN92764.1 hypothetical protein C7R54_03195 [Achromobacter aloeverae]
MRHIIKYVAAAALALGMPLMSGCTLGGAAAGGVIGHEATHGSTAGTVGGAVVGGVIGHEIGKD